MIEVSKEVAKEVPKGIQRVTYEDIGGLHDAIQKVREIIELPLRHPELFVRLGVEAPREFCFMARQEAARPCLPKQ